jgi:hypothetical protein
MDNIFGRQWSVRILLGPFRTEGAVPPIAAARCTVGEYKSGRKIVRLIGKKTII